MMLAESRLEGPDYFILVGYFVLMLSIGVYFYRRMNQMKDYFSGGNRIPWWLSGVSFYMTSFSAFAFVGYSAVAFQYGWVAVTMFWVTIPATLVSVIFFSSRWRRARIDSPVEYLESRYGATVRQLFAWQGIPVRLIDDGLKLVATGMFISGGLGMDKTDGIIYAGVIILAYTLMGGLWAVVITDFIQFVVMVAAVVILVPLSLMKVGGIGNFIRNSPEGYFSLTSAEYGWPYLLCSLLMFSLAYSSVQWALIQKYYCVPTERDAKKVGYLVAGLYFVTMPLMFIPAMAARQFLGHVEDTNLVYPLLCTQLLPAGLLGLIIAAMFSATMSTLSGEYNVCASVLTNDVYRRLIRPGAGDKELVFVGRAMTLLAGLVALVIALSLGGSKNDKLFRNMITLFSVATAPVGVPMLLGLLWKRVTNLATLCGFMTGLVLGVMMLKLGPAEWHWAGIVLKNENLVLLTTLSSTTLVLVMVSLIRPAGLSESRRIEEFHHRIESPIGTLPEDQKAVDGRSAAQPAFSPFRVVGILVMAVGLMLLMVAPFVTGTLALVMDLIVGGVLVLLGTGMVRTRKSSLEKEVVR